MDDRIYRFEISFMNLEKEFETWRELHSLTLFFDRSFDQFPSVANRELESVFKQGGLLTLVGIQIG